LWGASTLWSLNSSLKISDVMMQLPLKSTSKFLSTSGRF
jgi:hypothetical protein